MCDYTKVEYCCGHLRYTVRAWCVRYQESHKRCPPNVVAVEYRFEEPCGTPNHAQCQTHCISCMEYADNKLCTGDCKPPAPRYGHKSKSSSRK